MNIQQWRESKGYTVNRAAKALGLAQSSLWRIEAGEQWPGPATIEKIVAASGGEITAAALSETFMAARRGETAA